MLKKEIRKLYSQKRQSLDPSRFMLDTEKILQLFKTKKWDHVNVLMSYYPLAERFEFNVALCQAVLANGNPKLITAHPRMNADGKNMEAIIIDEQSVFAPNGFKIAEPQSGELIIPEAVEMIFVPLLAFDQQGFRVGYGKGFYDRFLARCKPEAVKVGFSFFEPVLSIQDIDQFDVPLNFCITPTRVYEF